MLLHREQIGSNQGIAHLREGDGAGDWKPSWPPDPPATGSRVRSSAPAGSRSSAASCAAEGVSAHTGFGCHASHSYPVHDSGLHFGCIRWNLKPESLDILDSDRLYIGGKGALPARAGSSMPAP